MTLSGGMRTCMNRHSRKRTAIVFCLSPAVIFAASGVSHSQEAASLNPVAQQALSHLTVTLNRPLFVPSRHKPQPQASVLHVEAPQPPAPPSVILLGILKSGNGPLAFLRTNGTGKIARVSVGDDVSGWKVAEIAARHIVLALDDRAEYVTLFGNQASKPLLGSEGSSPNP